MTFSQLLGLHKRDGVRLPRKVGARDGPQRATVLALLRLGVEKAAVRGPRHQPLGQAGRAQGEAHHRSVGTNTNLLIELFACTSMNAIECYPSHGYLLLNPGSLFLSQKYPSH